MGQQGLRLTRLHEQAIQLFEGTKHGILESERQQDNKSWIYDFFLNIQNPDAHTEYLYNNFFHSYILSDRFLEIYFDLGLNAFEAIIRHPNEPMIIDFIVVNKKNFYDGRNNILNTFGPDVIIEYDDEQLKYIQNQTIYHFNRSKTPVIQVKDLINFPYNKLSSYILYERFTKLSPKNG